MRPFDGESKLRKLQGAGDPGDGVHQKNSWSGFREFVNEDKMASVVEFAGAGMLGIGSVEIAHFSGQRRLGPEERRRKF